MPTGKVEWFEIRTPGLNAATAFYAELFGWTFEPFEPFGVTVWHDGDEIGLVTGADNRPGAPAGTLVYVFVEDLRATVEEVARLGGKVTVPPTFIDEESGAFACLTDPTGVEIGIWSTTL